MVARQVRVVLGLDATLVAHLGLRVAVALLQEESVVMVAQALQVQTGQMDPQVQLYFLDFLFRAQLALMELPELMAVVVVVVAWAAANKKVAPTTTAAAVAAVAVAVVAVPVAAAAAAAAVRLRYFYIVMPEAAA